MNIFIDLVFLFIYLYTILFFELPNVETDNYIHHKFFLFIALFVFTFVTQIISKIRNNCRIDQLDIMNHSIHVATIGIIGYSVYTDLNTMEWSKDYINNMITSKYSLFLMIAVIMVLFISTIKIIRLLFAMDQTGSCDNK